MRKNTVAPKPSQVVFNPDNYSSTGVSRADILELKDAFDLLDPTSSGKIDAAQLRNMLTSYGVDSHNQSLSIAVTEGTSTNKPIDFTAFLQIFTANFYAPKSRESYRKVFRLFDDQNIGCVTAKNLRRVIKELDLQLEQSQIQDMVDRADLNNDGVVSEEEFYQIMTHISAKI